MNFSKQQLIIIFSVIGIVLFFVLVFLGVIPGLRKDNSGKGGPFDNTEKIQISFWGVDEASNIELILDAYSKINQSVNISYTQFNESNYEKSLVNSLASGQGPDILMFNNSWLPKHSDKIAFASETQINLKKIRQIFPAVVEQDCVSENKIYCLPIYIDTLAFIYNKDHFDSKGIAVLPTNWQNFQSIISRLHQTDSGNKIIKAAAAIGGSNKSIDSASDLLSLIMLQNEDNPPSSPDAFNFYLQFSNPSSQYYTWNDNLRPSLDNFSQETTSAIFNYASSLKSILSKNPSLNLAVSPMLQFNEKKPINYPRYWALAVSKQSKNSKLAWDFIISASTNSTIAKTYLQTSKNPPALRSLIQEYINDPDIGIFASQALTAKNWQQKDNTAIKGIISNMIESVLNGKLSPAKSIQEAENAINQLWRKLF